LASGTLNQAALTMSIWRSLGLTTTQAGEVR